MVEAISGGEEVIVSEALSLPLAIFNHRSARDRAVSLNAGIWETASALTMKPCFATRRQALSPENAQAYIKMLRAEMQLGGYSNIIFLSTARKSGNSPTPGLLSLVVQFYQSKSQKSSRIKSKDLV
ncbi:MAG: hypothetical protein ACREDR_13205 [Blastocatellia bacterium]